MDLSVSQMMQMQRDLYELHKDQWYPLEPEYGKDSILFMVEEVGETIAVLKKKGSKAIMDNPAVREAFLTEMADVLMYYTDVLLRFHVTPEEISEAFAAKHRRNMGRDFTREYKEKYHG